VKEQQSCESHCKNATNAQDQPVATLNSLDYVDHNLEPTLTFIMRIDVGHIKISSHTKCSSRKSARFTITIFLGKSVWVISLFCATFIL
jgi:hypothetical protein